jgi:hypothetical protein
MTLHFYFSSELTNFSREPRGEYVLTNSSLNSPRIFLSTNKHDMLEDDAEIG